MWASERKAAVLLEPGYGASYIMRRIHGVRPVRTTLENPDAEEWRVVGEPAPALLPLPPNMQPELPFVEAVTINVAKLAAVLQETWEAKVDSLIQRPRLKEMVRKLVIFMRDFLGEDGAPTQCAPTYYALMTTSLAKAVERTALYDVAYHAWSAANWERLTALDGTQTCVLFLADALAYFTGVEAIELVDVCGKVMGQFIVSCPVEHLKNLQEIAKQRRAETRRALEVRREDKGIAKELYNTYNTVLAKSKTAIADAKSLSAQARCGFAIFRNLSPQERSVLWRLRANRARIQTLRPLMLPPSAVLEQQATEEAAAFVAASGGARANAASEQVLEPSSVGTHTGTDDEELAEGVAEGMVDTLFGGSAAANPCDILYGANMLELAFGTDTISCNQDLCYWERTHPNATPLCLPRRPTIEEMD